MTAPKAPRGGAHAADRMELSGIIYSASHVIETNEGPELAMYAAPSFSMGYAVAW